MSRSLVVFALFVLIVASCSPAVEEAFWEGFEEGYEGSAPQRQQQSAVTGVLVRESGTSDTVTDTFTLSQPCGKFVIDWTARATGSVPFINFRVYDTSITDYSIESSGPHSFEGSGSGKPGFPLSAGSYYIQVEGNNIRWSLEGRCES